MTQSKQKTFKRPSLIKKTISRVKRLAPSFVVDLVDFTYKSINGNKYSHPYHLPSTCEYQPFFIIGSGRSGNTLLRKLLVQNTEVIIPPEIPGLGNTIRCFSRYRGVDWSQCVEKTIDMFVQQADLDIYTRDNKGKTITYNLINDLDIDFQTLKKDLSALRQDQQSLSVIISSIYEQYSVNKTGIVLPWGDKTPWNIFHYARIRKIFPNAYYIHMLRDGRDVVASYISSLGEEKGVTVRDASYRWRDALSLVEKYVSKENNFLEIRYEDLTKDPSKIVSEVANFLNLKIKNNGTALGDGDDSNMLHHENLNKPITSRSVGSFQTKLSTREKKIAMRIIKPCMHLFRYD